MIGLLQRVSRAEVVVNGRSIGAIGDGLLVLVGVEKHDDEVAAERLLQRVIHYRVFEDERRRMNRSLIDTAGGLLLVPQFTLAADTGKGRRPSFSGAAEPGDAERLFGVLVELAGRQLPRVATGRFGADMQVSLTNDGPVTFWLQV